MWRENEREREMDGTLFLCFHNRTASSTWRPLPVLPRVLFPSIARLLGFLFSYATVVVLHRVLLSFLLACLHSFREVEVDKIDGAKAKTRSHLLGYTILTRKNENNATLIQMIKVLPHLAEILTVKFNVARKNCVTHPMHAVYADRTAAKSNP